MKSEVVVFLNGFFCFASYGFDVFRRDIGLMMKLLFDGSACALDAAFLFWLRGREDEKQDV